MAKDYFQDILPPSDEHSGNIPSRLTDASRREVHIRTDNSDDALPSRGIRSIQPPTRSRLPTRVAPARSSLETEADSQLVSGGAGYIKTWRSRYFRWLMWAIAGIAIIIVGGLALLSFRPTTVTVVPKTRLVTLTGSSAFVARPESAPAGASSLTYVLQSFDIEDSEVIAAQGVRHVENKASGSIVVFNEYSDKAIKLIKNTRFETPEGLIFRVPADVVVPGKSGSTPGQVKVTVVADAAGEKYNVGPIARFTLPGLKSGDMYSKVYARSAAAMLGGIVRDEPATAPGALSTAISAVRSRLATKAQETALAQATTAGNIVFPELARITYLSLPNTSEAGSAVRIHEKAHVEMPVMKADVFAAVVAQSVAEDVLVGMVQVQPAQGFSVRVATPDSVTYGIDPISFVLSGQILLTWNVDIAALTAALVGRESSAFETIVGGFPGIQEARVRILPPWKKTFPTNASKIKVEVQGVTVTP